MTEQAAQKIKVSNLGAFLMAPCARVTAVETCLGISPLVQESEIVSPVFTFEFDCGVVLTVSAMGYFVFDFSNDPNAHFADGKVRDDYNDRVKARMRFANLYLTCLYTELHRAKIPSFDKMYVDHATYMAARSHDMNPFHAACSIQQAAYVDYVFRRQMPAALKISISVLKNAAHRLDASLNGHGLASTLLADLLLQSHNLFQYCQYESAHVVAWTIIEYCLNHLWETYLDECNSQNTMDKETPFINSERRSKLRGRDFSASTISEILSLNSRIDFKLFGKVNKVRQDRNKWLHGMSPIDSIQSCASINVASEMLRTAQILDVDFIIPLITSPLIAFEDA